MTEIEKRVVTFKYNGDKTIKVSQRLNAVSGTLKNLLSLTDEPEVEIPIEHETATEDLELLNKFIDCAHEKFGNDVVQYSEDLNYWMSSIFKPQNKDFLLSIAEGVEKDVLIRGANLGDYLMIYPFLAFCTFILSERCQDLKLVELREFLNEEDDFDDEQRKIIQECPEFQNL